MLVLYLLDIEPILKVCRPHTRRILKTIESSRTTHSLQINRFFIVPKIQGIVLNVNLNFVSLWFHYYRKNKIKLFINKEN